jgi:Spy/CpxP family protein refolding chaperone
LGGKKLNKKSGIAILLLVFASMLCGTVAAANTTGPAPNAGDGVSDGSGFEGDHWQNGDSPGPAPNSGDCIPDGSGF